MNPTFNDLMAWCDANGASCSLGCDDVVDITTTIGEFTETSQVYRCQAQVECQGFVVRVRFKDTTLEALTEAVRVMGLALTGARA